jgi:hypothetical protein
VQLITLTNPWDIHRCIYRVQHDVFWRVAAEQGFQSFWFGVCGVHPHGVGFGGQYHGHAIVNWFFQRIGLGDDDGAGFEYLTIPFPLLPQSGKGKRLIMCRVNEARLLMSSGL